MPKVLKRECIAQPTEARNLCGYWLGRAQECGMWRLWRMVNSV